MGILIKNLSNGNLDIVFTKNNIEVLAVESSSIEGAIQNVTSDIQNIKNLFDDKNTQLTMLGLFLEFHRELRKETGW